MREEASGRGNGAGDVSSSDYGPNGPIIITTEMCHENYSFSHPAVRGRDDVHPLRKGFHFRTAVTMEGRLLPHSFCTCVIIAIHARLHALHTRAYDTTSQLCGAPPCVFHPFHHGSLSQYEYQYWSFFFLNIQSLLSLSSYIIYPPSTYSLTVFCFTV